MSAARTLTAKERGGPALVQQVLFYPVTDANFDTPSYHQFATGYFLRRDGMQWFWDQYTTDATDRPDHRLAAARHHRAAQRPAARAAHHR
ncbi:acetyl esterase/lipase [Streptomyces phaeogriseichromatogenes]|nr:acetyl esterase/lipase [Streptomyces murinus]